MSKLRLALFGLAASIPVLLIAQDSPRSASSAQYFLAATGEPAAASSQSSQFRLTASFGESAGTSSSAQHSLQASCIPSLHQPLAGRPQLSAVLPRYAVLGGGTLLELAGHKLDLGALLSLKVGGQPVTTVQARSSARLRFVLPAQPAPGWQPVELQTSAGTARLARGLGVLPLLEATPAAAPGVPFGINFRGSPGDRVVWALGVAPAAAPIPIGNFGFGLAIDPSLLLVMPGFTILGAQGQFELPIPASPYPLGKIYVQALFDSSNPGYAPGAFSNVLQL